MNKLITQLLLLSLFASFNTFAQSKCRIGEFYKQTKTLDFFSTTTKKESRFRVSKKHPLFLKITRDRRWGCEVQLFKKKNGQLQAVNNKRFIVSYWYLKKGTVESLINKIVTIPQKLDTKLTPNTSSCPTKPKEQYNNHPIRQKVKQHPKTQGPPFSSYSNSPAVDRMINRLKSNCSKFCCGQYCVKKLPNAKWCKSKFRRYWNAKIRTKTCKRAIGRCYGYVKLGLVASGKLDRYLKRNHVHYPWTPTANARDGGFLLKKAGYQNILHKAKYKNITSFNAPRGAILVYKAIPKGPGHIEVVDVLPNGKRKYYSDFVGNAPITNNPMFPYLNGTGRRKLIGIYLPKE